MIEKNWFKNAIIYHIFIDRFSGYTLNDWQKPIFLGGNIKGILEKLLYLQDLGITALWLSPFYQTNAYHGYHITDYFSVDEHFGTMSDLKNLIIQVHKAGMHIIADFVPNHCSHQHPFFLDAQKDKNSRYFNWFYFTKWPDEYLCFLSVKELPKINLEHEPAKEYIIQAAKFWLGQGLDGFRLDHVIGPTHRFWKEFRVEIKREFPDAVLIGEAWMYGIRFKELKTINVQNKYLKLLYGASSDSLFREYIGELDGVLDFEFQELISRYANKKISMQKLEKNLNEHFKKYPKHFFLPTFLDNHDMDRFLFQCKNDKDKLKEAAEIQFSLSQPPIIYYGTEVRMTQGKSVKDFPAYGDLQARQPMKWKDQDSELLDFYKGLTIRRRAT